MELEIQTETNDTEVAGVADTNVEATQTEQTNEATTDLEAAPAPEPQYQPSFKYKYDGQEKEIEEYYRPFIKTADDEAKFRELMEIRDAFPKHKELSSKYREIEPHYTNLTSELEQLGQLRNENPTEFLNRLRFGNDEASKQAIFKLAKHYLDVQDLTPEQKAQYDYNQRVAEEREQYRQQAERLQGDLHQRETLQKSYELDQTLGTAEVKSLADQYDAKVGNPGAFRQKIIQAGQQVFATKGIDISVKDAVNMVMSEYKPFLSAVSNLASTQRPKVIPNVSGLSSSPAAKQIKSLDDIKKQYNSLEE